MDALSNVLKITSSSMKADQMRLQVTAENSANMNSYNYAPKSVEFGSVKTKEGLSLVEVKKIRKNENRVQMSYDPDHPEANEEGMVTLPDINPITTLMDLQEVKQSHDRGLRLSEIATDLYQKIIKVMAV